MAKPLLFLYKRSEARVRALRDGGPEGYHLYGLPEIRSEGIPAEAGAFGEGGAAVRLLAGFLRRVCERTTGYGGNFRQTLSNWRTIRGAGALALTSNNAAVPVLFLRWIGFRLPPCLVISSGLEAYRPDEWTVRRAALSRLFNRAEEVVVFSEEERRFLVERVRLSPERLQAVPYGIPLVHLPLETRLAPEPQWDLVSVGADAQRDLPLLLSWARGHPGVRILLVAGGDLLSSARDVPSNVEVESDLSLAGVFERVLRSRAAVIPVRRNRYTAGTTFLVHALSCGRPVLVAETAALGPAYRIEESGCLLYRPEDPDDFARGMEALLKLTPEENTALGLRGRDWVRRVANGDPLLERIRVFRHKAVSEHWA